VVETKKREGERERGRREGGGREEGGKKGCGVVLWFFWSTYNNLNLGPLFQYHFLSPFSLYRKELEKQRKRKGKEKESISF
jgi:hypothetical protein